MYKRPVAIIEQKEENAVHLLIRMDSLEQMKDIVPLLQSWVSRKKDKKDIPVYLEQLLKGKSFRSFRMTGDKGPLDVFLNDDKDKAFIFCIFGASWEVFLKKTGYDSGKTLKWTMSDPDKQ